MSGALNAWRRQGFSSIEFHRNVLLPFTITIKGEQTDYHLGQGLSMRCADRTSCANATRGRRRARATRVGTSTHRRPAVSARSTIRRSVAASSKRCGFDDVQIPNPGWVSGVVGFGPSGPPGGFDPARRVLTFTTAPLDNDLEIADRSACPLRFVERDRHRFLHQNFGPVSPVSRRPRQEPQSVCGADHAWRLRASHRALDPGRSTDMVALS